MTTCDKAFLDLVNPYVEQLHRDGEPYVWHLKLPKSSFKAIADALEASMQSHENDYRYLLSAEFAPCVLVYVAEWYKRCYENPQSSSLLKDFGSEDWKTIWEQCGFPWEQYVYQQEEGSSRRWIDSIYALGGLALPFRLNQNHEGLLLKLCRLYHKEDISIEELSEVNGSIAFRQSILKEHSLHSFFEKILSGDPPYAAEELKDPDSDCSRLIRAIKEADKKACKEKFNFDWLIRNIPEREHMQRRLRISMKPEENGKYRQYISYERLQSWGIHRPGDISKLRFSLQFEDNNTIVKNLDFEHPLFVFYNRGTENRNFVCWGTDEEVIENHMPIGNFTKIQLWVKPDEGEPLPVPEPILFNELLRVFRKSQDRFEWDSRTNYQADTAVLFSDKWREVTESGHLPITRKSFYDREEGESEPYNWCNVFERIELSNGRHTEVIDCRKGKDYVFPKCYPYDICYEDGFTVEHHYKELFDEEDEEGEMLIENVPVLFGLNDLICKHFESKEDTIGQLINQPYCIKHKVGYQYEIVNSENDLHLGVEKLSVQPTESSLPIILTVFYVPWDQSQGSPVLRDFEHNDIRIAGQIIESDYERDFKERLPYQNVKIGTDDDFVCIKVYRPQNLVELYHKDKLIAYYDNKSDEIKIPLILCHEFRIRDYGIQGVTDYHCANLRNKYHEIYPLNDRYGTIPDWEIKSTRESAPFNYLHLCFFDTDVQEGANWHTMNFKDQPQRIECNAIRNWNGPGVIFDSLLSPHRIHCHKVIERRRAGFGNRINTTMTYLELFDIAAKHRVYFFLFQSLGDSVRQNRVIGDLLLPIIHRSESHISDQEVRDLQRFAFEFNFKWADKWAEWNGDKTNSAAVNEVIYRIVTL